MKKTSILYYLTIAVSLLASSGLWTERYLSGLGKSLCHTSACQIVAQYVRFGEPALLSIGAGLFLLLAGLVFLARQQANNPFVCCLAILTLIGSAAFDGALLGFQFITLGQHCQLCITVAVALGLIALLYSASLKKWSIALSVLAAWTAGFMANAILIMPDTTEAHSGMIFYERQAAKEFTSPPVATLIFSLACPHCTEVLDAIARLNPENVTWRLAVIDRSPDSIDKLGFFYANLPASTNPFKLLVEAKKEQGKVEERVMAKFPELTRQARLFLSTNGLKAVPVLVYKEADGTITMTTGSSAIVTFLRQHLPVGTAAPMMGRPLPTPPG